MPNTWRVTLLSLAGWILVNADNSLFNLNYPLMPTSLHITTAEIGDVYAVIYAAGVLSTFVSGRSWTALAASRSTRRACSQRYLAASSPLLPPRLLATPFS